MTVTIKDVARKAGVSTATVSRILNNIGPASEETRQKVRAVVEELRYVPSALGRGLSMRRTDAIGLLLPDMHGEFFSEVIRGSDQAARHQQYHLLVSSEHNDRQEIEAAMQMMRGRVDGVIIMSPHIDAQSLQRNLPRGIPAVLLNCRVEGEAYDVITVDNVGGAKDVVRHLLSHGHRRIAIVRGIPGNRDAEERLQGYRDALREAGISPAPELELPGDFSESSGFDAARALVALAPRPTAVFASNDTMAIGMWCGLRDMNIRIPQEIALAGFDGISTGRYLTPPLTSAYVAISDLGGLAVKRLLDAVQEKEAHKKQQTILPTALVIRESCGCPG